MRQLVAPSLLLVIGLVAGSAQAVAPCFEVCHLSQGQPVLLVDTAQIWARRCDTRAGVETCVAQRLDRSGKVLVEKPAPGLHDAEFTKNEFAHHTLAGLGWQSAWPDLAKPYTLQRGDRSLTVEIEKDTLVCSPPGGPEVRRPLGCAPTSVHVFATMSNAPPTMVAIAACAIAGGEREVIAVCD